MLIDFCHSRNQLIAAIEIHGHTISVYFREWEMMLEAEAFAVGIQMEMEARLIVMNSREFTSTFRLGTHEEKFHPHSFHLNKLLHFHYSFDKEIDRQLVDVFFSFLASYQLPKNVATRKRFEAAQLDNKPSLNLISKMFKFFGMDSQKNFSSYPFLTNKNLKKVEGEVTRRFYTQEKFTSTEVINFYLGNIENNRTLLSGSPTHEQLFNATCRQINSLVPTLPAAQNNLLESRQLGVMAASFSTVIIVATACWFHFFVPWNRRNVMQPRLEDQALRPRL